MSTQVYQLSGGGQASLANKPIVTTRDPTTTDTIDPNGSPYQILQGWRNSSTGNVFEYAGGGEWVMVASPSGGPLESLSDDSSVKAFPSSGNIQLAGTANQITTTTGTNKITFSLIGPYTPATYTAHGVLVGEGTSSIVATAAGTDGQVLTGNTGADPAFANIGTKSGLTAHGVVIAEGASAFAATAAGSAGQILTSGGASADPAWTTATFPSTVAAGALLVGTASNVVGPIADVATGQALMSGGVGVVPAYTGSPSFSGSVTAATTITATLGNITATNGNVVLNTAGNKLVIATGSNASVGTSGVMSGTPGQVTVATTASSATAKIFYARATAGGTLGNVSISAQDGTGFTLLSTGNETSTFNWWIINA